MPSYFAYDTNYLNVYYAMDIAIENYLKSMIFPQENNLSRIEYASNEYTFRQRTMNNSGELNMPYINYHVKSGGITYNNDFNWRNYTAYQNGIFLDSVGAYIKVMPVSVEYECTFWCNRDDEAKYVNNKVVFDLGSTRNPLTYAMSINTVEVPLFSRLVFDTSELDGQFTERDWLEKNKIHSVAMDFHVMGLALESDFQICLPDSIIFEFTNLHGVSEPYTNAERYYFIIDRFNETVTPE